MEGLIVNNMSANLKFKIGDFELSLANDTSCKDDGILRRHSFCIFDKEDKNVTTKFYPGKDEIYHCNEDDIFQAMSILYMVKKESNDK